MNTRWQNNQVDTVIQKSNYLSLNISSQIYLMVEHYIMLQMFIEFWSRDWEIQVGSDLHSFSHCYDSLGFDQS